MHIVKSNSSGDDYTIYLAKTYRDEKGNFKTHYIENLGKKSDLIKKHPDLDTYLKDYVEIKTKEEKEKKELSFNKTISFNNNLVDCKYDNRTKNIGFLYLLSIYNSLNLDSLFDKYLEETKIKYDLNKINQFLVFSRILSPLSKKDSLDKKDNYLYKFDDELHDIYRSLSDLDKLSNQIQAKIYKSSTKLTKRDTSILYYDCTNYYFETDEDDEDIYSSDGDILQYGFRKYGANKEHRPNPIVQMGLFMDGSGLPLSYCLTRGNQNEQTTVQPLEKQIANDFNVSKFIFCSDAGLCSKENKLINSKGGRAYLVTQSIKKLSNEQKDEIFSDTNWFFLDDFNHLKPISLSYFKSLIDKKEEGKQLTKEEELILEKDIIYKEIPNVIKEEIGKKNELTSNYNIVKRNIYNTLEERILITFSQRYYLYQKRILDKQILRANNYIKRNDLKYGPNDTRRLIDTNQINKETGEVFDIKSLTLDSNKIEDKKKYHGFYGMATNLEDDINKLLELNKRRWRIENLFRVIKSYFKARPVYLWKEEHIRGHFLICFEALFIYTLLENKINEGKEKYTTKEILEYLKEMKVVSVENLYYKSCYNYTNLLGRLEQLFKLGLDKENYKLNVIKKYMKL